MNDAPRRLLGSEREGLIEALVAAFDSAFELDELIKTKFNPIPGTDVRMGNLQRISGARNNLEEHAAALIDYFERRDKIDVLIRGARTRIPDNLTLGRFEATYFASVQRQISGPELERKVLPGSQFIDPASWREELEIAERRVCRIETTRDVGSGFLIAPDLVLTNHHVMRGVYDDPATATEVDVQFDFKRIPRHGMKVGPRVALHSQWDLARSPASLVDRLPAPRNAEPSANELDFAVVRLAASIGNDPIDGGAPRGWFTLSTVPPVLLPESAIFILQYPEGGPLKLAWETQSFLGMNAPGNRMRYRTYTEGGSSGSPCFDANWKVVGIHHSGDPEFQRSAQYNEGIPISAIVAALPDDLREELQLR